MTTQTINEIWNYYLTLEGDITNTSRFIEPSGQENVHSFEFAKILILACTELESVFMGHRKTFVVERIPRSKAQPWRIFLGCIIQ